MGRPVNERFMKVRPSSCFSDWRSLNNYYFEGEIRLRFEHEENRIYISFKEPRRMSKVLYNFLLLLVPCGFLWSFLVFRPPIEVVGCAVAIFVGALFFSTLRERVFFDLQRSVFVRETSYVGGAITGFAKSLRLDDPMQLSLDRKSSDIGQLTSIFVDNMYLTQIRGDFDPKVLLEIRELISFSKSQ